MKGQDQLGGPGEAPQLSCGWWDSLLSGRAKVSQGEACLERFSLLCSVNGAEREAGQGVAESLVSALPDPAVPMSSCIKRG